MKKAIFLTAIIFLTTALLCSCVKSDSIPFFADKDSAFADACMEELYDAIKHQDAENIKAIFSKKSINEAIEMDMKIDNLLSFVQGELISWHRDESPIVFDTVEYGRKTKQLVTWYNLNTTEQSYSVLLIDYPIDTIDAENAGLYSLMILRTEDENKLEGTWEEWMVPGIKLWNSSY